MDNGTYAAKVMDIESDVSSDQFTVTFDLGKHTLSCLYGFTDRSANWTRTLALLEATGVPLMGGGYNIALALDKMVQVDIQNNQIVAERGLAQRAVA